MPTSYCSTSLVKRHGYTPARQSLRQADMMVVLSQSMTRSAPCNIKWRGTNVAALTPTTMSRAAASSTKALQAILPLVSSGQPYEAHQKARTFASRYQKSNQFDTAIDVLFQSARELLKVGQHGSGTDLTLFLLDVYDRKPEKVTEESRGARVVASCVMEMLRV